MRLSFRGIEYEYRPVVQEVMEDGIDGTYRGVPSKIHRSQKPLRRRYSQEMIYRGVHYRIS
ncbi:MAG: DUF4278 domain-containing protein [Hydrococcus sp. C42_A2020_068]|uniref:DUF4278 domain-containing protein n=1 Tax=Pleurocapsa sp. PCC 7327 TaxID=118163 RepID=UPI00029FCFDB|nr:DUF4278 domain-containing protein [Pleurocapsa sp. PCC 7327]AFY77025.1 hypothetical protein Ple7327_1662 [Pleurocapsa sp. PCC 7327]MBF2022425.1 DUF4278 domain-containing protein [Hydrococcus sp. C42_A2020_068]